MDRPSGLLKRAASAIRTLPEQFETNGYDYPRFRRLFLMGTAVIWGMLTCIYLFFDNTHTLRGGVVAVLAAIIFMLVWLPLSIAQANKKNTDPFGPRDH